MWCVWGKLKKMNKKIILLYLIILFLLSNCNYENNNNILGYYKLIQIQFDDKDITDYFTGDTVLVSDKEFSFPNYKIRYNAKALWEANGDSIVLKSQLDFLSGKYKVFNFNQDGMKYLKLHSKSTDIVLLKLDVKI